MAWFGTLGKLNHPSDLAHEGSQMPLAVASRKVPTFCQGVLIASADVHNALTFMRSGCRFNIWS
jgi:hypothetical protein